MQTILTLNGKQYSVQASPGHALELNDIERIKLDILNGKIQIMKPATCHDVIQGTPQQITIAVSPTAPGVPPYTYKLLLDGSEIATAGPTTNTSNTYNYTFNQAVGSHTLSGEITDSCATPQTSTDQCTTFSILAVTTGSISCTTTPSGASVTLDGTLQTGVTTPVMLTNVSEGSHTILYSLSGYQDCTVTVTVVAGSTVDAPCTLLLCSTPDCEFTWSPSNPTTEDIITVTSSDTTLTSEEYIMSGMTLAYGSPFTMQIATAGTYSIQHNGENVCGNTCTKTKDMVISPACPIIDCKITIV